MFFSSWLRNWKRSVERRWALRQTLRRKSSARRPLLEVLEDRYLLSAYLVTSKADNNSAGTLRYGIEQVNAGVYNEIDFALGSSAVINLKSPLPALTVSDVYINGGAKPTIKLNGASAGIGAYGLYVEGANCTICGLLIENFGGGGIAILGSDSLITGNVISGNSPNNADGYGIGIFTTGVQVQGNFIGTDASGKNALGNGTGILVSSSDNTIGGTSKADRNVISGNGDGIWINNSNGGAAVSGVLVEGNYIGTDATGKKALGNYTGVEVAGPDNTIGGTAGGARNIISGNSNGVGVDSTGIVVQGNYIGTDVSGTTALGNNIGIEVGGSDNTIGGTTAAARNIISANGGGAGAAGIFIQDGIANGGSGNLVEGNYIGTDRSGTKAVGNSSFGVVLSSGTDNTIGGTTAAARNIISANGGGVLFKSGASNNLLEGDYIGLDISGTVGLGNTTYSGVDVEGPDNTIGGTTASARNIISDGKFVGVLVNASGIQVQGNYIGTDKTGKKPLGNYIGVEFGGASTLGGTTHGARNLISGNSFDGVVLNSDATVQGNAIGTDVTRAKALANGGTGIRVYGNDNTIGGTTAAARNLISGNGEGGVTFTSGWSGLVASGNLLQGNYIGTDVSGSNPLGNNQGGVINGGDGVFVSGSENTIGGTTAGAGNVIAANVADGISIASTSVASVAISGTLVQGNHIGIDAAGKNPLGNGMDGILIAGNDNTIGGTVAAASNIIADNAQAGVYASGVNGNTIRRNSIFANGSANSGPGIVSDLAAPALTSATLNSGTVTVKGSFAATANSTYVLEFFANPQGDPEGKVYLGSRTVTATTTGTQKFTFKTTNSILGTDPVITATLTEDSGETSAFSNGVTS